MILIYREEVKFPPQIERRSFPIIDVSLHQTNAFGTRSGEVDNEVDIYLLLGVSRHEQIDIPCFRWIETGTFHRIADPNMGDLILQGYALDPQLPRLVASNKLFHARLAEVDDRVIFDNECVAAVMHE
ncbi:hypothetical protein AQ722_19320 [Burkholderia pseudomallei]|nr:hypothetical protein AQ722_19320 [Burkholderia pseudomallei]